MDKNKIDCPKHGDKYMVDLGRGVTYCGFPTPGERFSKCFYHPSFVNSEGKAREMYSKQRNIQPNVMKVISDGLYIRIMSGDMDV